MSVRQRIIEVDQDVRRDMLLTILRLKLIVKVNVNTAPRIPPEVIKPNPKVTDENNEVTIGNETSLNKNITTNKNLVSEVNIIIN